MIVPTYGRAQLLNEAVQSVLDQTIEDFECLVVNDAGPSISAWTDPRVLVVDRDTNGGAGASRNTGLRMARGRYVAFLDDDDLYTPGRLELALQGLQEAPIAMCGIRNVGGGARRPRQVTHTDQALEYTTPHVGRTAMALSLAPMFDETFPAGEDDEWWIRMPSNPIACTPVVGYIQRHHPGTRRSGQGEVRMAVRLRLLETYPEYFAERPKAAAWIWKRVGAMALEYGPISLGRRAMWRSLRLAPKLSTTWHLSRAYGHWVKSLFRT